MPGGSNLFMKCDIPRLFASSDDLPPLATSSPARPTESSTSASSSSNVPVIVGATVGGVLGVVAIAGAMLLWRRHRYQVNMYDSTAAVVPEYVRE
ncbi:hypothetical protein HK104_004060 [Borealophlyctis nickersoniae]|nr:hypothetical protein HK104_004060 [Borealophlyctis nickersoniae]